MAKKKKKSKHRSKRRRSTKQIAAARRNLKKAHAALRKKYGGKKSKPRSKKRRSGYARAKGILGARERRKEHATRSTALATLKERGYTNAQAKKIYARVERLAKHRAEREGKKVAEALRSEMESNIVLSEN